MLYITSEGVRGAKHRLVAMREKFGIGAVPFGLIPVVPNLGTGTTDRDALIKEIRTAMASLQIALRAIVIDTVRSAIPGKSEYKPDDLSIFVNNCSEPYEQSAVDTELSSTGSRDHPGRPDAP